MQEEEKYDTENRSEERESQSNRTGKKYCKNKEEKIAIIILLAILVSIALGVTSIITREKKSSIASNFSISNTMNKSSIKSVGDGIGLIELNGVISFNERETGVFGFDTQSTAEKLSSEFKYMIENSDVLAIVISIDSPGGSVTACEATLKYMRTLKEESDKPVIVSFKTMAASGGYWMAMIGDEIFANESTLTGSIGVISQFLNVKGFLDKYGVEMYSITSGKNKDSFSPFRTPRKDELEYWQNITDQMLNQFTSLVKDTRGDRLKGDEDMLFDGRIFSGKQAVEYGLVDQIGNLNETIEYAANLVELDTENPNIIRTPTDKVTPLSLFLSEMGSIINTKNNNPYEDILKTEYVGSPMYLYMPGAR